MRRTLTRLAESVTSRPLNLQAQSATLLPPLPLYRSILRAHRHLPEEMRGMGDDYVKAEFRRHVKVDNPVWIIGFLSQWKVYLDSLPDAEGGLSFRGKRLDPTKFEKLSQEQLGQLYELMHATKDIWKSPAELQKDADSDSSS